MEILTPANIAKSQLNYNKDRRDEASKIIQLCATGT